MDDFALILNLNSRRGPRIIHTGQQSRGLGDTDH